MFHVPILGNDELLDLGAPVDRMGLTGIVHWALVDERSGRLTGQGAGKNLVTQIGDTYYAARAANLASPPAQVTGMHLGNAASPTAVAKTGAGAAVTTYKTGSNVAIDATYPQGANQGNGYRITWRTTWAAGTATDTALTEVMLVNQSIATDSAATASNTIARALFSSSVNKGAGEALIVTWYNDVLGA